MKQHFIFTSLFLLLTACGASEINRAAVAFAEHNCLLIESPASAPKMPEQARTALNTLIKSPDLNAFKVALRTALEAECGQTLKNKSIDVNQLVDALTRAQD